MFAKVFSQIYDSSIVENPEARFTFMDFLVLAEVDGVVDMTHEAIARRTNRPIEVIRQTIAELEQPDPRSRTPDFEGARIKRLDDHRDWGWKIINYEKFRLIANDEQRRKKTQTRVRKWRQQQELQPCNASVTLGNAGNAMQKKKQRQKKKQKKKQEKKEVVRCSEDEAMAFAESIGCPASDGKAMFLHWEEKGWPAGWKLTIRKWKAFNYLPSQKQNGTHQRNNTESRRNVGTANEGRSAQYKGVGRVQGI